MVYSLALHSEIALAGFGTTWAAGIKPLSPGLALCQANVLALGPLPPQVLGFCR